MASTRSVLAALVIVALLLALVGASVTGCTVKPHTLPPTPYRILNDNFNGSELDRHIWVAHGDSIQVSGGMLRIVSSEPWDVGVEAVEHFFRPRENDYLTVRGSVFFPADTLSSSAIVNIQDHWRDDDPDCYFFEFERNRESVGDNAAYFGVKVDGAIIQRVSLGSFENGDTVEWGLRLTEYECMAEVGDRSYTTDVDVHDLGVSLHGSGSAVYWGFVAVTLWDVSDIIP